MQNVFFLAIIIVTLSYSSLRAETMAYLECLKTKDFKVLINELTLNSPTDELIVIEFTKDIAPNTQITKNSRECVGLLNCFPRIGQNTAYVHKILKRSSSEFPIRRFKWHYNTSISQYSVFSSIGFRNNWREIYIDRDTLETHAITYWKGRAREPETFYCSLFSSKEQEKAFFRLGLVKQEFDMLILKQSEKNLF